MTLAADMTSDLDDVFFDTDEHAITITYNGTDIPAIPLDADPTLQDPEAVGEQGTYVIQVSDVTRPAATDVITISGNAWSLLRIVEGGADVGTWTVVLTRGTRRLR